MAAEWIDGRNPIMCRRCDENGPLASQYAGKIMEIYNQYRWQSSVAASGGKPKWEGLADNDKWQISDPPQPYDQRRLRELDFWFGVSVR
jgi:hypothetical protein